MEFTWDPVKNAECLARRRFDFAYAARIFLGFTLERVDGRHDYGEQRTIATGWVEEQCLTAVYTDRVDPSTGVIQRRIITAWESNRRERKAYAEAVASR